MGDRLTAGRMALDHLIGVRIPVPQVFLSLALPFVIIPLIIFTGKKKIMGEYANKPWTSVLLVTSAGLIIFLNILLLYQVLGGSF